MISDLLQPSSAPLHASVTHTSSRRNELTTSVCDIDSRNPSQRVSLDDEGRIRFKEERCMRIDAGNTLRVGDCDGATVFRYKNMKPPVEFTLLDRDMQKRWV